MSNAAASVPEVHAVRHLPRYHGMVLCVLALMLGIVFDDWANWNWRLYLAVAVTGITAWLFIRVRPNGSTRAGSSNANSNSPKESLLRHESLGSTVLLIGLIAAGAFWHHGRWNWFGQHEIGLYASEDPQPVCMDAIILSEPRFIAPSEDNGQLDFAADVPRTRVALRVLRIRDGRNWKPVSGGLDLVIHAPAEHVRSGDTIRVWGRLVKSNSPTNPGQFDFQSFYRAKGKLAFLHAFYSDSVHVIEPASWLGTKVLSKLRRKLNAITWRFVDGDEAAFASAILLGNREQLSSDRRDLFIETGTAHLLAISGLHVGILAGSFFLFFRIGLLSRKQCLLVTICFAIFYAWLVEFRPPVSRAAILIVLYCIGRLCGESSFSFNLLAIAGLIVLLLNPMDLFGLGPQLSFLAVATLTFGKDWVFWPPPTDPIKHLIATTRPFHVRTFFWLGRQLRTAILVSGLIWVVAVPLVAYRFHLVAPVALIVNPLLLVPIAWALYGGLGVLVLGSVFPPAAHVAGWVCELNLSFIEWIIGVAQALPLSHFWTAGPSLIALTVFYLGLFFAAVFPSTRLRLRWVATLVAVWFVFGWFLPDQISKINQRSQSNPLVVTFVDVGHGTGVLLQLPNGQNMLYDCGSFGSAEFGFRNVAGVLWNERIEYLDAVVISHADIDHFNALAELSRRFSIGVVIMSPQMLESDSPAVATILDLLKKIGVPVRTAVAGNLLKIDERFGGGSSDSFDPQTVISVLNPPVSGSGGNDNSDSILLLIEHAGQKILLPGDLESAGLDFLLHQSRIDCDLVMAAHHGSINSRPADMMRWSTPEYVVISGGSQRVQDSAVEQFKGNGRSIFRTDHDGAIRYSTDGIQSRIVHWDGDRWRSK